MSVETGVCEGLPWFDVVRRDWVCVYRWDAVPCDEKRSAISSRLSSDCVMDIERRRSRLAVVRQNERQGHLSVWQSLRQDVEHTSVSSDDRQLKQRDARSSKALPVTTNRNDRIDKRLLASSSVLQAADSAVYTVESDVRRWYRICRTDSMDTEHDRPSGVWQWDSLTVWKINRYHPLRFHRLISEQFASPENEWVDDTGPSVYLNIRRGRESPRVSESEDQWVTKIDRSGSTCTRKVTNPMLDWIKPVGSHCQWTTSFVFETFQLKNLNDRWRWSSPNQTQSICLLWISCSELQ